MEASSSWAKEMDPLILCSASLSVSSTVMGSRSLRRVDSPMAGAPRPPLEPTHWNGRRASRVHRVPPPPGGGSVRRPSWSGVHERADGLAEQRALDVARLAKLEHQDGQAVLHAQGDGRGVHDREA